MAAGEYTHVQSTYRLQLRSEYDFAAVAETIPYLAKLGISHLYLSPVLQAAPGSTHGYDVIDHTRLSDALGGQDKYDVLVRQAREHGLGIVLDVVPNHMAVPTPAYLNAKLWAVLRDGPASPFARWFDVDWSHQAETGHGAILMPVLGDRIGRCLERDELTKDEHDGEPVLRYYEHVFPIRPGTEDLPIAELLDQQYYRLAYWRVADEELNYRRFFDVDTLAAVRMEEPEVFAASHDLLLQLHAEGKADGFRIDHPDGLADPAGYLAHLADATNDAWVVAEKILEADERLPADWRCAGTSGYDTLWRIQGVFVDQNGADPLLRLWRHVTGQPAELLPVAQKAKRHVVEEVLAAEVVRLVELVIAMGVDDIEVRDYTRRRLTAALTELLVAFDIYRAYVRPGETPTTEAKTALHRAAERARTAEPDLEDEIVLLTQLALGERADDPRHREFCVRFQQTTGPVQAKGIEDTAFYRWYPLAALCEVGSPADRFGLSPSDFHHWAGEAPNASMTTLSTHDTKRSEDVRARLITLTERPDEWGTAVATWRAASAPYRPAALDAATEYLLWQVLVGAWPVDLDRLTEFLAKATREAKLHTSWTQPEPAYDDAVRSFAESVRGDSSLLRKIERFVERLRPAERCVVLGQKLVQLTCPGVPDTYQGSELAFLALVDPDNRRLVDYTSRRELLEQLDAGKAPATLDEEKLLVVSRALRCRRDRPSAFAGAYEPLEASGPHAFAFLRGGQVATVTTRLPKGLERTGGWGDATVTLPPGTWTDELTGSTYDGGDVSLATLLDQLPVALLSLA